MMTSKWNLPEIFRLIEQRIHSSGLLKNLILTLKNMYQILKCQYFECEKKAVVVQYGHDIKQKTNRSYTGSKSIAGKTYNHFWCEFSIFPYKAASRRTFCPIQHFDRLLAKLRRKFHFSAKFLLFPGSCSIYAKHKRSLSCCNQKKKKEKESIKQSDGFVVSTSKRKKNESLQSDSQRFSSLKFLSFFPICTYISSTIYMHFLFDTISNPVTDA